MRRSTTVSACSLLSAATLLLSACGGGGDSGSDPNTDSSADVKSMATGKAQQGDTFTLAQSQPFDTVTYAIDQGYSGYNNDTPDANTSYNTFILVAVLAGAHIIDGNNKVLLNGDVMQSVTTTSTEPLTVEWKMKPNVKWSDGEAWDCDDFYLAYLAHSGRIDTFTAASTTGYDLVEQAGCKDELTFEATFGEPYLDFRNMFEPTAIMPAHILEQETGIADITALRPGQDDQALTEAGEFWTKTLGGQFDASLMPGSGPYKIASFDPNADTVTLERNPHWIGAKGGPNQIVVRAIPDTKAMATALQNGEIDVAGSVQPDATAASTIKNLASQGVTYGSAPRLSYEHLDLNLNRIFADEAARKAFFQAIDRQEIVDKLIKPVQADAQPLNGVVFLPGEEGFTDVYSDKLEQGPEAAARTLEAAGWVKGPDGIYAKDGERFSVTISHNENARRSQTVEILIPQLKAAGIEVRDETDPNFLKGRVDKGDYDVALFGWSSTPFKSTKQDIFVTGGNQNWQGLSDPAIDQAFETAVAATEESVATQAYQEADRALAESYATVPLFQTPSMWGFRGIDRVFMQSYYGALWNVGEWERTG
jgi:peptide/nickel transport system substrate-binding protein